MNKQRAKEITESADLINVMYNGKQIYIQHVDNNTPTARVYQLDDPQNEFNVHLDQLEELK
ncbi:H-type small acid-soluble spore protein [Oceanobacillus senegalensis]|uniref:H-type small acid-soluble spore protein n=1 Tax=Oceanobacillus senegalensis TaxID=1936063 RepID=UPI000A31104C|nr:H-type small acid-soluble spore protein [Oceanobacillus senegalensis]